MTQEHSILYEGAGYHVIDWATPNNYVVTSSNPRNYSGIPQRETIYWKTHGSNVIKQYEKRTYPHTDP